MKPFLKIDKRVQELNDSAAFVYMVIVYSIFKKKQINRRYLAESLKVKNLDYISEILSSIEKAGLISRKLTFNNAMIDGYIDVKMNFTLHYKTWFPVEIGFLANDASPRTKGFALRYRSLAFDDSISVGYTKSEAANLLNVSRPTLNKNLTLLNANSLMDYFIKLNEVIYLDEKKMKEAKELSVKADKESKLAKQINWFLNKKIYTHKKANSIFNMIISGTLDIQTYKQVNEASNSRYSFGN